MSLARKVATAFAVMLAASAQLNAQNAISTASPSDQPTAVAAPAEQAAASSTPAQPMAFAPTDANARVGVHAVALPATIPAEPEHEHMRHSEAMMIVGGAILIVGAVVGGRPGTIIMIGGGTVGIIGLIRFLQ
ncbi:MAG: hypothetical protein ACHQSE_11585 [Gemmatimonadales bacterium]